MPASVLPDVGKICRVEISGRLQKRELDVVQAAAADRIRRGGPIRLLIELNAFTGWEPGDNWQELGFFVRYGNDVERIAIVGDDEWRDEALMFAAADLRRGDVAYFRPADRKYAIEWVGQ